jgi:hypothetical protein
MPSLDQLLAPKASEQTTPLVEGELVRRGADPYLKVNGQAALWGPLRAAGATPDGTAVLVAVSQTGDCWVVASDG